MNPDRMIQRMFRIKAHDSLPCTGWAMVTRDDIPRIWQELGYKIGAEIGVAQASFSRFICETVPGVHLICVDPWVPYDRVSQAIQDKRYRITKKRLAPYDVDIKRMTSMEAAATVPDGSLDFVYIDGDHKFDGIMLDLILWAPKVRAGGIVAGHDYYPFYQADVIPAVNTYTQAHHIYKWYVTKDVTPSFLWVKV